MTFAVAVMNSPRRLSSEMIFSGIKTGIQVVRLEFARKLAASFQVWGIPVGENTSQFLDLSGMFEDIFPAAPGKAKVNP